MRFFRLRPPLRHSLLQRPANAQDTCSGSPGCRPMRRRPPTSGVPALPARQPQSPAGDHRASAQRPRLRMRASSSSVRASPALRSNGIDPVTVIDRQASVDAGFTSTAEVLQCVGVTGGTGQINDTFGGLVVEGGPGVNTLSAARPRPDPHLDPAQRPLHRSGRYARSGWRGRLERASERRPRPHRSSATPVHRRFTVPMPSQASSTS